MMTKQLFSTMRAADDPKKFYAKLGPFFASKSVRKEIGGYPLDNEPDWNWIVATGKRVTEVEGFVSLEPGRKNELILRALYPSQGDLPLSLLAETIHFAKSEDREIFSTVPENQVETFKSAGFTILSEKGKWSKVRWSNESNGD